MKVAAPITPRAAATRSASAGEPGALARQLDGDQAHALQLDAPFPALTHLLEDGPGDRFLRRNRIDVGAERGGAVRVGGAEREIHAATNVFRAPARYAIASDRLERGHERAVGVGRARPDVALVDMGVAVDEGRAAPSDRRGPDRARSTTRLAMRSRTRNHAVGDERSTRRRARRCRAPGARSSSSAAGTCASGEPILAARWNAQRPAPAQFSRFTALSCHFRRSRYESRLVAPKIATPVSERSTSAAKRRGMFSRCCASIRRKARPEFSPAVPAANSATTAAISASPPAIRRPGEEIGEGVRKPEMDQRLPAARAVELEEVQEIVVGGVQALRGVGEDREEGDEPGADQQRLSGRARCRSGSAARSRRSASPAGSRHRGRAPARSSATAPSGSPAPRR